MKKNMKKGFALALAVLMALSSAPSTLAFAETQKGWTLDYEYYFDEDGTRYDKSVKEDVETTCVQGYTILVAVDAQGNELEGSEVKLDKADELDPHEELDPVIDEDSVIPATCKKDGSHVEVVTCKNCGEEVSREKVVDPALGHLNDGTEQKSNETCTGYDYKIVCAREDCNVVLDEGHKDVENHVASDKVVSEVPATCTEDGEITYECVNYKKCNGTVTEVVEATGHVYTNAVKENEVKATCTTDGSYTSVLKCDVCGEVKSSEEHTIPATGHTGTTEVVKPATCAAEGEAKGICTTCKEEYTVVIEKTDCKESDIDTRIIRDKTYVAPTCVDAGECYVEDYCKLCGKVVKDSKRMCEDPERTLPALGHDYKPFEVTTAPTCTRTGRGTEKCTRCDAVRNVILPRAHTLGESYIDEDTHFEATCEFDEEYDLVADCSACGAKKVFVEHVVVKDSALGHDYVVDEKLSVAPTCGSSEEDATDEFPVGEDGLEVGVCCRCGDVQEKVLPALVHNWVEIEDGGWEPTCSKKGRQWIECTNCESRTYIDIPKTGHDFSNKEIVEVVVEPATCTEPEVLSQAKVCAVCGFEKLIGETYLGEDALGHDWKTIKETTPATCTKPSVGEYECQRKGCVGEDGKQTKTTSLPALGHDYVKHFMNEGTCEEPAHGYITCSRCTDHWIDMEDPDYVLGHVYEITADIHWNEEKDGTGWIEYKVVCTRNNDYEEEWTEDFAVEKAEVLKAATCVEEGAKLYTITIVDEEDGKLIASDSLEVAIPLKNHKRTITSEVKVEPTCTEDGSADSVDSCTVCGKEFNRKPVVLPALGHTPERYAEDVKDKDGNVIHEKDSLLYTVINEKNKDFAESDVEDWTWDEVVYCTVCGDVIKEYTEEKVLEKAPGHNPGRPVRENVVEATCTTAGSYDEVVYCTEDNEELSRVERTLAVLPHTYVLSTRNIIEATCTKAGSYETYYACSVCGAEPTGILAPVQYPTTTHVLDPNGHVSATKTETVKEATCTEAGEAKDVTYCTVCDEILAEGEVYEVEATGHVETEVVGAVEAKIGVEGYTGDTVCKACGEIIEKGEVIPALEDPAPAAPQNVKATGIGSDTVQITWDAVEGADGYIVYAQNADGGYHKIGLTAGTSFVDEHASDINYSFYWVFAYSVKDGKVVASDASKYVFAKGVSCPAVTDLKATAGKGFVKLTWTAAPGADGYIITGIRPGQAYANLGNTTNTTWTDTKADTSDYTFYWVFGYKVEGGKMVPGATAHYTYGKAR